MSAFLCSDAHLSVLVAYARAHRLCESMGRFSVVLKHDEAPVMMRDMLEQQQGEVLRLENERSLCARYPDDPDTSPFVYKKPAVLPSHVAIIKLCQCYEYQACETPDYEGTAAALFVQHILSGAIRNLPGYEAAPWSI